MYLIQQKVEYSDGFYTGELIDGKKQGFGRYQYKDGTYHEGDFDDDKPDIVEGTVKYPDGSIFVGRIFDGKKNKGKLINADGSVFHDGIWNEDKP